MKPLLHAPNLNVANLLLFNSSVSMVLKLFWNQQECLNVTIDCMFRILTITQLKKIDLEIGKIEIFID